MIVATVHSARLLCIPHIISDLSVTISPSIRSRILRIILLPDWNATPIEHADGIGTNCSNIYLGVDRLIEPTSIVLFARRRQRTLRCFHRDYYVKRGGIFRCGERPAHSLPSNCKGHSRIIANYPRIIARFIRYLAEIFLLPRCKFHSSISFLSTFSSTISHILILFFIFVGISLFRNFLSLLPLSYSIPKVKKKKRKKRSFLININRYFIVQYLLP